MIHVPPCDARRRDLRARHIPRRGGRLLPAPDLRRPRGPRRAGRRRATRTSSRSSPASTIRACASSATSATAGSPRPTTRSSARAVASSSPCSATTTSASPTASPARSPSSTAIPTPGVAHGAASIIDGQGVQRGTWPSQDRARHELLRHLVREHNTLVDPSRMVHRRVYEAVGGYSSDFRLAQDFDFWVRAVRAFRFRDVPGRPAHRPAPPRRELLRRVGPGAGDRRRCRTRCAP